MASGHRILNVMKDGHFRIPDPGTGNRIEYLRWGQSCSILVNGTETNTIPAPTGEGQRQTIFCYNCITGSRTITVVDSSAFTATGDTSLVFNTTDDLAILESVDVGSDTYEWRVVAAEGTPASLGTVSFDGITTAAIFPVSNTIDIDNSTVAYRTPAGADSAVTNNVLEIAYTTPVDTTGTQEHNALNIDLAIGNATGGTNTVNAIKIDDITGDAQVTETAINVGTGWDSGITTASPVTVAAATQLNVGTVAEVTAAAGVTVDGVILKDGLVWNSQGAPTAETGVATITAADILTGIVTLTQSTGGTVALTLDTGTAMDTALAAAIGTDKSLDWSLINLSAAALDTGTLTAAAGHTIVGNPIVQSEHVTTGGITGSAGMFRTRRTATNTWITYRIG